MPELSMNAGSKGSPRPPPGDGTLARERRWTDADGVHIDVRGLAPPGPLVAILALVEAIGDAPAIIVHHDRDPKLLYPELAELGWVAVPLDAPEGEVRLKLERGT